MRAVDKGAHPIDSTGAAVAFTHYRDAAPYLHERLGRYCSYCEREFDAALAVEHVLPKSKFPDHALNWDNFLLACVNCNSRKGDAHVARSDGLWPDTDNTFAAFEYRPSGAVTVNSAAGDASFAARAARTLSLVGLDLAPEQASAADHRHTRRLEEWGRAQQALRLLCGQAQRESAAQQRVRAFVVKSVTHHYSIWAAVFRHDAAFLEALAAKFPGTRRTGQLTPGA